MTKICIVSDTHNQAEKINLPEGDILIHCGDFTGSGSFREFVTFGQWFKRQKFKHKILINGNHDWLGQSDPELAKSVLRFDKNTHILQDQSVVVEGIKFYGSAWTPFFYDWAFNLKRGQELKEKWDLIPDDTEFLITHGPPASILDLVTIPETLAIESAGCVDLKNRVDKLSKLKVHCFGHLHENYGQVKIDNKLYINASQLDDRYRIKNKPVEIEV